MLFRNSFWLLLLAGCEQSSPYNPCELSNRTEVHFEDSEMLCVQLELSDWAFYQLSRQFRFQGSSGDQFAGVIGHMLTSCDEPFPDPYTYFAADLWVGGLQANDIGVRKKGFIGSTIGNSIERPSLRVKTDKFIAGQALNESTIITLNNNNTDATRMRTCLTYYAFQQAGYPAPRCNLANVMVNGQSLGTYTHVEAVKEPFLLREFGNDHGSLYELTITDFSEAHLANGLGRWEADTETTSQSAELLLAVAAALASDDASLETELSQVLELEMFLDFWALETLLGHADGYAANSNNSYVYFDPDRDNRAVMIPWGPDDAMQENDLTLSQFISETEDPDAETELNFFVNGAISRRISQHPELYQRYLERLQHLLDQVWDEDSMLEKYEQLQQQVQAAETLTDDQNAATDALEKWIENRRSIIETFIANGGAEGLPGSVECFDEKLGEGEELGELAELVSTASYSCSTGPATKAVAWMLGLAVLGWRTRRQS